jgi:hypothetical protein
VIGIEPDRPIGQCHPAQAFLRTLELNPNYATAMYNFSVLDTWYGRFDDAIYWGRRGLDFRENAPTTSITYPPRMRRDVDAQRPRAAERGLLDVTNLFEPVK